MRRPRDTSGDPPILDQSGRSRELRPLPGQPEYSNKPAPDPDDPDEVDETDDSSNNDAP